MLEWPFLRHEELGILDNGFPRLYALAWARVITLNSRNLLAENFHSPAFRQASHLSPSFCLVQNVTAGILDNRCSPFPGQRICSRIGMCYHRKFSKLFGRAFSHPSLLTSSAITPMPLLSASYRICYGTLSFRELKTDRRPFYPAVARTQTVCACV